LLFATVDWWNSAKFNQLADFFQELQNHKINVAKQIESKQFPASFLGTAGMKS
jgi:hypothetical protein